MGSHIAVPYTPFGLRIRKDGAILTGGEFLDFLAVSTLFDNCVASTTIELTAFLAHEEAIRPLFYACTNHFNHILSLKIYDYELGFMPNPVLIVKQNSHKILVFKEKIVRYALPLDPHHQKEIFASPHIYLPAHT